jgi:hypothetical protein
VLDLYARVVEGVPWAPDDYVISADEKSQLQALARRQSVGGSRQRTSRVLLERLDRHQPPDERSLAT